MTQKEKLFRQYMSINNEIVAHPNYTGTRHYIDIEESIAHNDHKNITVAEYSNLIANVTYILEQLKAEAKLEEFYSSEKGQEIKLHLEYQKSHWEDRIEDCYDDAKYALNSLIKKICGESFTITTFNDTSFEVAYTDNDNKPIFGHNFSVYRHYDDKNISMNYPTLGSFNPFESPNRVAYLEGMAKFSNPNNFTQVIKCFNEFIDDLTNYRTHLNKINKLLSNPYELAA